MYGQCQCKDGKATSRATPVYEYKDNISLSIHVCTQEKLVKDLSTMDDVTQLMQKAYKQCDANS